jgi:hypothetical protein
MKDLQLKQLQIKENKFKVIVKTNSKENEIVGFDETKKAYKINLKAKPIDGKANIELIKFLSRELKKQVRIVRGLTNKEKIIETI